MGKAKKAKRAATAEHRLTAKAAKNRKKQPIALLGAASEVADQPPLVALSLTTLAIGAVLRRRAVVRTGARMLIAHAIATGAKTVLKRSVDRARPARALEDGKPHAGRGKRSSDTDFNSFPSGHTAGAVAVAEAVANTTPQLALPGRISAAGVAAMQLPRGAHYLSDVAVGAALGWVADRIAGALIGAGERAYDRRGERQALGEVEAHPS
jgi:membrane-associated phospholipid phosphatase